MAGAEERSVEGVMVVGPRKRGEVVVGHAGRGSMVLFAGVRDAGKGSSPELSCRQRGWRIRGSVSAQLCSRRSS